MNWKVFWQNNNLSIEYTDNAVKCIRCRTSDCDAPAPNLQANHSIPSVDLRNVHTHQTLWQSARLCSYPISRSCSRSTMHTIMETVGRELHLWFTWTMKKVISVPLTAGWLLVPDFDYYRNCWSPGNFSAEQSVEFIRRKKIIEWQLCRQKYFGQEENTWSP